MAIPYCPVCKRLNFPAQAWMHANCGPQAFADEAKPSPPIAKTKKPQQKPKQAPSRPKASSAVAPIKTKKAKKTTDKSPNGRSREAYNAYMRDYMAKRAAIKKAKA